MAGFVKGDVIVVPCPIFGFNTSQAPTRSSHSNFGRRRSNFLSDY